MQMMTYFVLVCLGLLGAGALFGLKYPRALLDWPYDRKRTAYIAVTGSVFLVLFTLLWYVSSIFDWPPWGTLMAYIGLATALVLAILGIVVPRGIKLEKRG